mmetsp:Transcript_18202/g.43867  ORF Transcript_18202/g.43867 Transcript_18202/m.43867 type:complete len:203 (-) Transcript_18202:1371-1979(-)
MRVHETRPLRVSQTVACGILPLTVDVGRVSTRIHPCCFCPRLLSNGDCFVCVLPRRGLFELDTRAQCALRGAAAGASHRLAIGVSKTGRLSSSKIVNRVVMSCSICVHGVPTGVDTHGLGPPHLWCRHRRLLRNCQLCLVRIFSCRRFAKLFTCPQRAHRGAAASACHCLTIGVSQASLFGIRQTVLGIVMTLSICISRVST